MDQEFSPLRRLTPELFDHYVAKARAERAQAIAEFGGWIARQVRNAAAGLVSRGRTRLRSVPVARKLDG
jgi:hypothetical protein